MVNPVYFVIRHMVIDDGEGSILRMTAQKEAVQHPRMFPVKSASTLQLSPSLTPLHLLFNR